MSLKKALDYVAAMKEVDQELNCPLIDHTALICEVYNEYGEQMSNLLPPDCSKR